MNRKPQPLMVDRECANCGQSFKARASDARRGWGLYCGKSCKAKANAKGKEIVGGAL
ncbi:hypothetical protein [Pseudomonas phage Persinger]|uniref:DUF2256 domain-containing protein n=1 Tax=Pseudomonas phage Persinger TaxID=2749430 RepID=A0A7D7JW00_9CAUD|nr:hypothetical protein KB682_gp24 [Pseudomonas phage Persinger]QMP19206.1 hypothetical protein [Pseudomonas phage Persinger]